jgi:hypothetical protein
MNLESTRPRGRPKNRWQDEVREDGRIIGGEEWLEKVCNRENGRSSLEWQGIIISAHANGMNAHTKT